MRIRTELCVGQQSGQRWRLMFRMCVSVVCETAFATTFNFRSSQLDGIPQMSGFVWFGAPHFGLLRSIVQSHTETNHFQRQPKHRMFVISTCFRQALFATVVCPNKQIQPKINRNGIRIIFASWRLLGWALALLKPKAKADGSK